jgi:hypothetical protein
MSKYDEEYQHHFTGLRGYKIYAHGTFYAKNIEYNPVNKEILVGPTFGLGKVGEQWYQKIRKVGIRKKIVFRKVHEIYSFYELSDLAKHPAIVIFPYAVMSYSIVDFYSANIPIFVPSIWILAQSQNVFDRSIYFDGYCGKIEPVEPNSSKHIPYDPNSNEYKNYRFIVFYMFRFVSEFVNCNKICFFFKLLATIC